MNLTPRAAALIAPSALRRAVDVQSESGRRALAATAPLGAGERAAWVREQRATRALAPLATGVGARRVRSMLRRLEPIDEALDRLRRDQVLGDADLLRLTTMIYTLEDVGDRLADAGSAKAYESPPAAPWSSWLRRLHPEAEPAPRFELTDAFDAELGPARRAFAAAARALLDHRRDERARVEAVYGVRFNARGEVVVRLGDATATAMSNDAALRVLDRTAYDCVLGLADTVMGESLARASADAEAEVERVELAVRRRLSALFSPHVDALAEGDRWLGRLDLRLAKLALLERWSGSWPEAGDRLSIRGGFVPRIRERVEAVGGRYTLLDIDVAVGTTVITGPNMGGKTACLALCGTVQWLAQMAFPVPAAHVTFPWVGRVDYVGGELGSFDTGLSSFGGEMEALSETLADPTPGLLLIDELGRGTSPAAGAAIAVSTAAYLSRRPGWAVMSTHHPGVGAQAGARYRVAGLAAAPAEALREAARTQGWPSVLEAYMDYRLVDDDEDAPQSDALRIAALFGLPAEVLDEAERRLRDPAAEEKDE